MLQLSVGLAACVFGDAGLSETLLASHAVVIVCMQSVSMKQCVAVAGTLPTAFRALARFFAIALASCMCCAYRVHSHGNAHAQLKRWKLEPNDTTLLDLLPFLEAVVRTNVPDVRKVVASYDGEADVTAAFRARMQQLQAQQAEQKQRRRGLLGGLGN